MKRRKIAKQLLTAIISVVTVGIVGMGVAAAASNRDQVVSGTTNHSVYKFGQTVTVNGTVNGDIFCAGQTVDIDATVNGDVLCAGQTVTVNGTVNGNVRVVGQDISVGAKVEKATSLAGQTATLTSSGSVGADLSLAAETANIDGQIGRDLNGTVHSMNLSGKVGRDLSATVTNLDLASSARIAGNLTYTSNNLLSQASGASVGGVVRHNRPSSTSSHTWFGSWAWRLYVVLALLVLAMVLVALIPQVFVRFDKVAVKKVWLTFLTGFVAMFAVPAIILALVITFVGIPLAVILAVLWAICILLSAPLSAFYVGRLVWRGADSAPLVMLLGSLILGVVFFVPILGFFATILAIWFGTGSILRNLKAGYPKPEYKL